MTQALIDHDGPTDATKLIAVDIATWVFGATLVLGITRRVSRHPRNR